MTVKISGSRSQKRVNASTCFLQKILEKTAKDIEIDLFGGTELIALDVLSKTEKKRRGTEKTQRLSSQVPHNLREIDVSMVKVVSTARRAVVLRCIGCGINGQL